MLSISAYLDIFDWGGEKANWPQCWFLDALASLKPILFTQSVSESVLFFGLQITSESTSENEVGLF